MTDKRTVTAAMITDLITLVCSAHATESIKSQAINHAYEIGKIDGRLEGAKTMGAILTESIAKVK